MEFEPDASSHWVCLRASVGHAIHEIPRPFGVFPHVHVSKSSWLLGIYSAEHPPCESIWHLAATTTCSQADCVSGSTGDVNLELLFFCMEKKHLKRSYKVAQVLNSTQWFAPSLGLFGLLPGQIVQRIWRETVTKQWQSRKRTWMAWSRRMNCWYFLRHLERKIHRLQTGFNWQTSCTTSMSPPVVLRPVQTSLVLLDAASFSALHVFFKGCDTAHSSFFW